MPAGQYLNPIRFTATRSVLQYSEPSAVGMNMGPREIERRGREKRSAREGITSVGSGLAGEIPGSEGAGEEAEAGTARFLLRGGWVGT